MSTLSNVQIDKVDPNLNLPNTNGSPRSKKPRQLELLFPAENTTLIAAKGDGSLSSYSMQFAVLEIGTSTPIIPKQRGRFKNFGVVAISDAPREKFGSGPHFILVEMPFKIEEPKLESRTYGKSIHTPVAIIGKSSPTFEAPAWIETGEWIDTVMPTNRQLKQGKVIGEAKFMPETNKFTVAFENRGKRIVVIPPTLTFENPFPIKFREQFISPFTPEAAKNWILLVKSDPNKMIRTIHPASINENALTIPSLKLETLKASCECYDDEVGIEEEEDKISVGTS